MFHLHHAYYTVVGPISACHCSFGSSGAAGARACMYTVPICVNIPLRRSAATYVVNTLAGLSGPQDLHMLHIAVTDLLLNPETLDIDMSYLTQVSDCALYQQARKHCCGCELRFQNRDLLRCSACPGQWRLLWRCHGARSPRCSSRGLIA